MVNYDEYKKIVISIMNEIYEAEKQRYTKVKKLRTELIELRKNNTISESERFVEILHELLVINSIDERFNFY